MKRSEAVKKIKSIIATCGPTQPTIDTAERVLDMLEKAGMLPPERKEKFTYPYYNKVWTRPSRTWEPECEIPEYAFKCNNCTCED